MPKQIPLTCGAVALVDDEDYDRVAVFNWTRDANGYVCRKVTVRPGVRKKIMLHRFILRAPAGYDVDHKDGDLLNCTRDNIRIAHRWQNAHNRGACVGSRSPYKGVYISRQRRPYAQITVNGKKYHIGTFNTEEEAARAYDRMALRLVGEFASLNFPPAGRIQNG